VSTIAPTASPPRSSSVPATLSEAYLADLGQGDLVRHGQRASFDTRGYNVDAWVRVIYNEPLPAPAVS
jgi:hypothetical protein